MYLRGVSRQDIAVVLACLLITVGFWYLSLSAPDRAVQAYDHMGYPVSLERPQLYSID